MSLSLSPPAVASAICHIALALVLLDTRVQLSGVREHAPASHRSLLSDAHVPELRKEVELINARFDGLQSARAAEAAELRDELKRFNKEMKTNTGKVHELRLDVDELRGPKRRRRRRRAQNAQTCDAQSFRSRTGAAMDACCPEGGRGSGQGHRILQADCELPESCPSAECAATFTSFFEDCTNMLGAAEVARLRGLYADCQELESNAQLMLNDAEPAMIFHVIVLDDASAQAESMFGGGHAAHPPDPLRPLPPPPTLPTPPSPGASGAVTLEQFQAVCTKANLATCVPPCGAETQGYLLSIQIDGRGTVMTCNIFDGSFSWQGQASLGGYIGANFAAFFSAVISGAAGTYMATLSETQNVHTSLTCQPGQAVFISGDRGLAAPPTWGSGGFTMAERASLSLVFIQLDEVISISSGAIALSLTDCVVTFAAALVLHLAEARFSGVVFQAGLLVPGGARVTIAESEVTFAAGIPVAITVQSGGRLILTQTTLTTQDQQAGMLHVDDGGSATVEDCHLISAEGSNPFPCDGHMPTCLAPHTGLVVLHGVQDVRAESPLVCDAETGRCDSVTCPPFVDPVNHATDGYVYDNPARTFGTTVSCAIGFTAMAGEREWTCQINGTWSGIAGSMPAGGVLCSKYSDGGCTCADTGANALNIACNGHSETTCLATRSCRWVRSGGGGACEPAIGCEAVCRFKEPCVPTEGGLHPIRQWAQMNGGNEQPSAPSDSTVHAACLAADVVEAGPSPPPVHLRCDQNDRNHFDAWEGSFIPSSPTINIASSGSQNERVLEVIIDCAKTAGPCAMKDRIEVQAGPLLPSGGSAGQGVTVYLHRLLFANLKRPFADSDMTQRLLKTKGNGGAIAIHTGNSLAAVSCVFEDNFAFNAGGAIWADGDASLTVIGCLFQRNTVDVSGGAIYVTRQDFDHGTWQSARLSNDPGLFSAESSIFLMNGRRHFSTVERYGRRYVDGFGCDGYCCPTPSEQTDNGFEADRRNGGAVYCNGANVAITSSVFEMNLHGRAQVYVATTPVVPGSGRGEFDTTVTISGVTFKTDFVQSCAEAIEMSLIEPAACEAARSCFTNTEEDGSMSGSVGKQACYEMFYEEGETVAVWCCSKELSAEGYDVIPGASAWHNGNAHALEWEVLYRSNTHIYPGVYDDVAATELHIDHAGSTTCCAEYCSVDYATLWPNVPQQSWQSNVVDWACQDQKFEGSDVRCPGRHSGCCHDTDANCVYRNHCREC